MFPLKNQWRLSYLSHILELNLHRRRAVLLLVVINGGASLSVWKDAKRKAALWEGGRGRWKEEMRFDWQGVWEWVTGAAPWIGSCGPILGCGDTCVYVCGLVLVYMHSSVHMVQSNSFSHRILVAGLVCWRKMKVVWRANHNTAARFLTQIFIFPLPARLKSSLQQHRHSDQFPITSLRSHVCRLSWIQEC